MPEAFIWYHADENMEPAFIEWLEQVEEQADVRGKLFIRKENDKTTFLETYTDVSRATINRIEKMAVAQPIFNDIHRQCESFVEVTS
ncbi:MAG: hypothetical protein Q9M82_01795 [Mariprofundus sp.]|nr:hypothetical protein [Mariprofundus sp.]